MRRPPVRLSAVLFAALAGGAPLVAVLVALVGLGALGPGPAFGLSVLLMLAAAAVATWVLRRLADLEARVDELGRREPAAPGEGEAPGVFGEIASALQRQDRAWRSERRELEATLAGLKDLIDAFPHPLLTIDADLRVLAANRAARAWFGAAALEGRAVAALLRVPEALDAIQAAIEGGPMRKIEFALPENVERRIEAQIHALTRRAEGEASALVVLQDVTAARLADRMRYDFVANVSHELRTPLSALVGFIETLGGPAKDDAEARARFLALMGEQAARMSRLVEDLLSLSRIEMDEHAAPKGRVEIEPLLRRVAELLAQPASRRGMRVEIAVEPDSPAAKGDADQLMQLFVNLVDNAIKYARAGTPIRIEAGPAAFGDGRPALRVAVRDQGEGIAREHLPRLTERFYRVDAGRSRQSGGTGLGLAIVKHVVNRHRGVLRIESEPGVGSTFAVLLPVAGAPPSQK